MFSAHWKYVEILPNPIYKTLSKQRRIFGMFKHAKKGCISIMQGTCTAYSIVCKA